MQNATPSGPRWYVISLRPRGMHAPLRAAAVRARFGFIALSSLRIVYLDDDASHVALNAALACDTVVFSSPVAVRAACASLAPNALALHGTAIAAGSGTAAALRRAGVGNVQFPTRMDGEGVLALPSLQDVVGQAIGLVTAPGGRGVIDATLHQRGARLLRADVYRREACAIDAAAVRRLAARDAPLALMLSSGEALDALLPQLDAVALRTLHAATVVASSERLAMHARAAGFQQVRVAAGPRPRDFVDELNRNAS